MLDAQKLLVYQQYFDFTKFLSFLFFPYHLVIPVMFFTVLSCAIEKMIGLFLSAKYPLLQLTGTHPALELNYYDDTFST
ncbi:hypothetical protein I3843_15G146400 [Carya illinoinensis]|nr:hypothetical protein I3843_15G146400 [Carya illinoinensis]